MRIYKKKSYRKFCIRNRIFIFFSFKRTCHHFEGLPIGMGKVYLIAHNCIRN